MLALIAKYKRLASAFVAGAAVAAALLVATWIQMPSIDEVSITSTRSGRFGYIGGGARSSSTSSVNNGVLWCSASITGAGASCVFSGAARQFSGEQVSVEETRVRALWGTVDMVVRVTHNGAVIYSSQPQSIRDSWRSLSIFNAFLAGFLVANACYILYRPQPPN